MFQSLEEFKDGSTLEYDICIVGSGIASHAMLSRFLKQNPDKKIAVLEGSIYSQNKIHRLDGGVQEVPVEQTLYEGDVEGWIKKNEPNYLLSSRQRAFGGTTNIWSGWCVPLDRYDLERENRMWPISYYQLEEYYHQAQNYCFLPEYHYDEPKHWINKIKYFDIEEMPLEGTPFKTRMVCFNHTSLTEYYYPELLRSSNVHIFSNANCLEFEWSQGGKSLNTVSELYVRTIENQKPGRYIKFKASQFILAAGALETTRLLLLSGVGRVNNNVGKYFMEHPFLWVASRFDLKDIPDSIQRFYFSKRPLSVSDRTSVMPILVPKEDFIRYNNIGNFRVLLGGAPHIPGTINISWEQEPSIGSELSLSQESVDFFGQKKLKINHVLSNKDKKLAKIIIEESQILLRDLKYGSNFESPDLNDDPLNWVDPWKVVPGNHPMGTTRMSHSSQTGVVDENCRAHDFENLYIASSSVFPTGGYANSTFTIIALSLRLSDHIGGML